MAVTEQPAGKRTLGSYLPQAVLAPSILMVLVGVYGFMLFSVILSFTGSKMFPRFVFTGFDQYARLFDNPRWDVAVHNIFIFAFLYIFFATALGLLLAILIDQKIRAEAVFRTIFLYPMALSFIVTGVIWQWLLNPGLGLERMVQSWGWAGFSFKWLVEADMAIYTGEIARVWQVTG